MYTQTLEHSPNIFFTEELHHLTLIPIQIVFLLKTTCLWKYSLSYTLAGHKAGLS